MFAPKGKSQADFSAWLLFNAGDDLLSHTLSRAVQSARRGLTSVFGMGTGGSPAVRSPTSRSCQLSAISSQQLRAAPTSELKPSKLVIPSRSKGNSQN